MSFIQSLTSVLSTNSQQSTGTEQPSLGSSLTSASQAESLQTASDKYFGLTGASGYTDVSQGLAYLQNVNSVTNGADPSSFSNFGQATPASNLSSMNRDQGTSFVKTALGFGALMAAPNSFSDSLHTSVNAYAGNIFDHLVNGTFSSSGHIGLGQSLSADLFGEISNIVDRKSLNAILNVGGLNLSMMFGHNNQGSQFTFNYFGGYPALKLRMLFYCDIEFWDGTSLPLVMVRDCSGPKATVVYDEANFYGYRSQIAKRSVYEPATLVMYDDTGNRAMYIYDRLMSQYSGLYGKHITGDRTLQNRLWQNGNGFDNSSIQAMPNENGIIKNIITTRIYSLDGKTYKDVVTYGNVKLTSCQLSDMSMEAAEPGTIDIGFMYDALVVDAQVMEDGFWRQARNELDNQVPGGPWNGGRGTPPAGTGLNIPIVGKVNGVLGGVLGGRVNLGQTEVGRALGSVLQRGHINTSGIIED